MAKTNMAKTKVIEKIKQAFEKDYVGEYNGKLYVWAEGDNGKVQISISLTQPKTPVAAAGATENVAGSFEWGDTAPVTAQTAPVAEITQDEEDNLRKLMAKLGL